MIDMLSVYDRDSPPELQVADWDQHPNEFAHSLIAERFEQELKTRDGTAGCRDRSTP